MSKNVIFWRTIFLDIKYEIVIKSYTEIIFISNISAKIRAGVI